MYTESEKIEMLHASLERIKGCRELTWKLNTFEDSFSFSQKEHAVYGIGRRLLILSECVSYFFEEIGLDADNDIRENIPFQGDVYLHSYLINCSGILDNIAWLIAFTNGLDEKNVEKEKFNIGLFHKKFKYQTSEKMKEKCNELASWYEFIKSQRHPTAHRISPYIIPYICWGKGSNKDFTPHYIHSMKNNKPILLHSQCLIDITNIIELVKILIEDLSQMRLTSGCM